MSSNKHSSKRPAKQPRKPSHGAVAILVENGKFLVIRRSEKVRAPNMLCFAGGTIEPGETPEQTIVREMQEELGLDVICDRHVWQSKTSWGTLLEWMLVHRSQEQMPVPDPDEVSEWFWFSGEELLAHQDTLPSVPAFFVAWSKGAFQLPAEAGQPRQEWCELPPNHSRVV